MAKSSQLERKNTNGFNIIKRCSTTYQVKRNPN